MHFQVRLYEDDDVVDDRGEVVIPGVRYFDWQLERADSSVVCRSADQFLSEREARSDIAQVKRTMAGAGRYKVRSPE
jgi:hypothetical protein